VLVLDKIEILPPLVKYKYNTWRILPVKCYIDDSVHLWICIQNVNKDILRDDNNDKRSFKSESVVVIRIGVDPAGEEPDQHVVHLASRVLHTRTLREVPTKSKLGPCSRMKFWPPVIIRPERCRGLPHSPSNKPPRSRAG
jgi:hypothetical protein